MGMQDSYYKLYYIFIMNGGLHDILHSSIHNEGLNNGWNLILESIMCGYGNHE